MQARSSELVVVELLLGVAQDIARAVDAGLEDEVEITRAQHDILRALARSTHNLGVADLGREIGCSRINATRLVERLARDGRVTVTPTMSRNLYLLVRMTPGGADAWSRGEAARVGIAERRMAPLGVDEKRALVWLLQRLRGRAMP